jgi:hypothetical protein
MKIACAEEGVNLSVKDCGNLPQGKQTTPAVTKEWAIFIPTVK